MNVFLQNSYEAQHCIMMFQNENRKHLWNAISFNVVSVVSCKSLQRH
jgi:hypothetical protein